MKRQSTRKIPLETLHSCKRCLNYELYSTFCQKLGSKEETKIRIINAETELYDIFDRHEIIIKDKTIDVMINYPLDDKYTFTVYEEYGFSRENLILHIVELYEEIYKTEIESFNLPVNHGILKPYGIWGYELDELFIDKIFYNDSKKIVTLSIYQKC